MDRGRGRGRVSNKARRTQASPDSHITPNHSSEPSSFTTNGSSPQKLRHTSPTRVSPFTSSAHMMDPATHSLTPRSERTSRNTNLHHLFSIETPADPASAGYSTRKRTKSFAMGNDRAADETPVEKGGHTLRKRSRVDYSHLVDDDLSADEHKPDSHKKPAHTLATQARKRRATQDLSGDESDNVSAGTAPKRRRTEKENTAPRSTSKRRKREVSRQPPPTIQPSVEHPSSDNEVQDTILVGGAVSTTDSSSQAESSISPVLSRSLPQVAPFAPGLRRSPSIGPQNGVTSAMAHVYQSMTGHITDEKLKNESTFSEAIPSGDQAASKDLRGENDSSTSTSLPRDKTQADSSGGFSNADESLVMKQESHADEHDVGLLSSQLNEKEDKGKRAPFSKDEEENSKSETVEPLKELGPQRLSQLIQIYETAQQQEYQPPLVPYEGEEVIHPASWTELVYPQATPGVSTPAPTVTPRPSPPPKDPAYIDDSWDPTTKITMKALCSLYHKDTLRRRAKGQPRISLKEFHNACSRRHKEALANPPPPPPEPEVVKKTAKPKAKAKGRAKRKRGRTPEVAADPNSPAALDAQLQQEVAASVADETPRPSPAPESQPPTAAPSPEPEAEGEADNQPEVEQDAEGEVVETETENGPVEPEMVTRHPKKQYLFKKLPDVGPMEEALENFEDMDDKTLYQTLESAAKTAKAWQDEFNELKKITDDEDNAKRRAQNDKAIENWDSKQKLDDIPSFRRTFDEAIQKAPPPFDVKGVRAPKPYIDDPVQEHQRQEDRIMAQAYGFDYKADKASIGKQDPIAQRWETSENRLRDTRRQTQKAADAADDGVILEGKRTRKPRVLEDHSAPASRATTPVPAPRQRQRKTVAVAPTEEPEPEVPQPVAEPVARKRGPRGKAKAAVQEEAPQPEVIQNGVGEEAPQEEKPKAGRKRARTTGPHPLATTTYAEPEEEQVAKEEPEPPAKRQRKTKEATTNDAEIPAGSFYSQSAAEEPRRPSTSSSSGTANTAATIESAYSLRDKKPRNFAAENDPIAETTRVKRAAKPNPPPTSNPPTVVTEEKPAVQEAAEPAPAPPKKKRVRVRKKAPVMTELSAPSTPMAPPSATASPVPPTADMMMHTFSAHPDPVPVAPQPATAAAAPPKKALPKIKIINGYNGHAAPMPAPPVAAAPSAIQSPILSPSPVILEPSTNPGSLSGSAEPPEKPYAEMSKSEKMSYSMRRRWAAGEMQGAVQKRKNTLARKAEQKATAPPPDLTPKPLQPASAAAVGALAASPVSLGVAAAAGVNGGGGGGGGGGGHQQQQQQQQFLFQEGYFPSGHPSQPQPATAHGPLPPPPPPGMM